MSLCLSSSSSSSSSFSMRSYSMFAAIVATALASAACTLETNDVYSPDEQRSDVAAIARGETAFPVAPGASVPDANGVATKLTPTMRGIRVRFMDLMVNGTCDSEVGGEGEF